MDSRWFPVLAALALSACERPHDPPLRSVEAARAPGEVLLDLRSDGALLFGTVQPVPPFSDAPRAVLARWLDSPDQQRSSWTFDGIPVLDVRFVQSSQAAVVLTSARELVLVASSRALPTRLDVQVHAPLALSADGRFLAYARGELPDLEIVRYDLSQRTEIGATQHLAPAWSPALSEDGARLLFMSGATGFPELFELREDQSIVQRSDRRRDPVPFPSGPSSPVWSHGLLAFEAPEGVHLLSLEPLRLIRTLPGTLPVAANRSRALIVQSAAGGPPLWLPLDSGEVAR